MRLHRTFFVCLPLLVCGAGALDGQTVVTLGESAGGSASCALSGGATCTLSARVTGNTNASVTWNFSPTVSGAVIGTSTGPDATGLTTISYKAPNPIPTRATVTVTATAVDGAKAQQLITLVPPTITVQVSPASVALNGGQSQQFAATVLGVSQTTVTWSLSPQVGTIDNSGFYTAPMGATTAQKITVTATSTFDSTVSGTATVSLNAAGITISPATVTLTESQNQTFTATVTGASTGVVWSLSPQVGTLIPQGISAYYAAPATVTVAQKLTLTAASTDGTVSGTATITLNVVIQVGQGAPNLGLQGNFVAAFGRNGFSALVSLPPLGLVRALGTTGYVQEFSDAAGDSGVKLALATVSPTSATAILTPVVQLYADVYAYYTSTGVGTAGYPLLDTQTCPTFDPVNSCTYDLFDKGVALFAYAAAITNGQNFSITGTFYTEWTSLGGINGPGQPVSAQAAITAAPVAPATTGTTATTQAFGAANSGMPAGAIYSITSGPNKGKIFGVIEPMYDLYSSLSGPAGSLGLPTSEAVEISSAGLYQQTFEGGALQATAAGGTTLLVPVASVALSGVAAGTSTSLSLGQSVTVTAVPLASNGTPLTGRVVSWTTTNSQVVSIQANGATAVITAAGGGAASVQASSGGVASAKANFVVIAPCCQVGDGAPSTVQQAFLAALARNGIVARTPVAAPASRAGAGYIQALLGTNGTSYLLAQADGAGAAYIVWGALLAAYQALGGPSGSLGYPTGDASPGGTQLFAAGAALAGTPVQVVSGGVLAKWAALGYETGAAGLPLAAAAPFTTPGANSGYQQTFANGVIYAAAAGRLSGKAYFVSGAILALYNSMGGPAGNLGMPTGDASLNGQVQQQSFEFGSIGYAAGAAAATAQLAPRTPAVTASPAAVTAGGQALVAVTGFANNAALRVSVTGEPDFLVTAASGAYSWTMPVALTAKSGTLAIRAVDTAGTASAGATLTVNGFDQNRIQMTKSSGDGQTGLPGAALPLPLQVALLDPSGVPLAGVAVSFQASAGTVLSAASVVTDGAGHAAVSVRLPAAAGVAAVTAGAAGIAQAPVTFYATAAASTLANFPPMTMAGSTTLGNGAATIGQKGALLTAVASILRYHQNRAELPAPNGLADPPTLNSYLQQYCTVDLKGSQVCDGFLSASPTGEQVVNPWRAAAFTGGITVTAYAPSLAAIADVLAEGSPALVSLALARNGQAAGGTFVVATGVAADGSIAIQDPNPFFAQTGLNAYLNGFGAGGANWTGTLRGVVQFARQSPGGTRFLLGALSQPASLVSALAWSIQSAAGTCGTPVELDDTVDSSGNGPAGGLLVSRLNGCDGLQPVYQVAVGAAQPFQAFLADLASAGSTFDLSGSAPATYLATRSQLNLALAPAAAAFTAAGVVNAATFTAGIAPGGILAIFGAGLSGPGTATTVDFDGAAAAVLLAQPFQVNAVAPAALAAGSHTLHVHSAYGDAQQNVNVAAVAPVIFLLGSAGAGAVTNQDNSPNGPSNPLPPGQDLVVYCTGLGAVAPQGKLSAAAAPVTVVLNGQNLQPAFAGLTPGVSGLYQVNVQIPNATPPGIALSLALKQGGQLSNAVFVAVQ